MVNAAILTTINYLNDNSVNTLLHCNNYHYTKLNKSCLYQTLKDLIVHVYQLVTI